MGSILSFAAWALLLMGLSGPAQALKYKAKKDQTLAHIARMHYGHSKKFIYLTTTNSIKNPAKLSTGKTLWIPTVRQHRIKRGEGLPKVARKYLKDSRRADFLMWLNRIENPKDIKVGTRIAIPFLIRHRVKAGETMLDLAKKYYWKSKPAGLLRKFNKKRTNALKAGEIVLIPIYDPEASTEKVQQRTKRYKAQEAEAAADAKERAKRQAAAKANGQDKKQPAGDDPSKVPAPAQPDPDQVAPDGGVEQAAKEAPPLPDQEVKQISQAFDLYRDGEYELARANLERLLEGGNLPDRDESRAREVLANCLVALGLLNEAEHEFVRLLMIEPELMLDQVTTSPKVLEVFHRARGSR